MCVEQLLHWVHHVIAIYEYIFIKNAMKMDRRVTRNPFLPSPAWTHPLHTHELTNALYLPNIRNHRYQARTTHHIYSLQLAITAHRAPTSRSYGPSAAEEHIARLHSSRPNEKKRTRLNFLFHFSHTHTHTTIDIIDNGMRHAATDGTTRIYAHKLNM